ncbi:hypothetical protein B0H17DRAFT_1218034 [Mycena rosella]|uniref:Uncharacterized protein n=1 Tax=Mycena rosella TaxID=1033263 RepID=A0AAD7FNW2_MYCRO|nr:hypothetical protein B0H17DRAFT_1218034 [Mycena rosella]
MSCANGQRDAGGVRSSLLQALSRIIARKRLPAISADISVRQSARNPILHPVVQNAARLVVAVPSHLCSLSETPILSARRLRPPASSRDPPRPLLPAQSRHPPPHPQTKQARKAAEQSRLLLVPPASPRSGPPAAPTLTKESPPNRTAPYQQRTYA